MGSQHLGFKRKQQPELLCVWKPRLRCSVSSAIVLVIVNLGHLPGGISHSSNKLHKANHKVLHCRLPLIEFRAHKHISKYLTARSKLSDYWLPEIWLPCLFSCAFPWQEACSFGSMKGFFSSFFFFFASEGEKKKGGGGWKADRRGLGRSAIFQKARHTTWSLITHKALCNPSHRLGCIIRLNKTWPSLSFTPSSCRATANICSWLWYSRCLCWVTDRRLYLSLFNCSNKCSR